MSGTRTPPRARISGQLASTGTIASEDWPFKDEVAGREFYIPFRHFAHAFLPHQDNDHAIAITYQQSPEFRIACASFHSLATGPETDSVYVPLVRLMNSVVNSERERLGDQSIAGPHRSIPGAVHLQFTSSTNGRGIKGTMGLRKPDMCGVQRPLAPEDSVTWPMVSIACEYKRRLPPNNLYDVATTAGTYAQPPLERPRLSSLSSLSSLSNHSGPSIPSRSQSIPSRSQSIPSRSQSIPPRGRPSNPALSRSSNSARTSPAPTVERDIQLGQYLLEMRSHQVTRDAVLGILFMGSCASFWYSDSDSTIKSHFIPVDSSNFIVALMCLARAGPIKLGYSPHFRTIDGTVVTSQSIDGARFIGDETAAPSTGYELRDIISLARALHGRCARVMGATEPGSQEAYVVKYSYQVTTREHEANLIQQASERGVKGVVRLYRFFTLKKLSEGPRSRLPSDLIPGMSSCLLVEDREIRVLVLARCTPLFRVTEPRVFLAASISLLNTICDLYEQGKILHRDISVHNLMVQMCNPSEGVLIDLDHAVDMLKQGDQHASSLHRSGTLPFMALDLLHDADDYPQYLRHDLESFVYVLFWIAGRYESGNEVNTLVFNQWCMGGWAEITNVKLGFLVFANTVHFNPTSTFQFLTAELVEFRLLLSMAHLMTRARCALTGGGPEEPTQSDRRKLSPVKPIPYPVELAQVNRDAFLSILNRSLNRLNGQPPNPSTGA